MRTPLRPLARIIDAREKGENPDHIEAEERAKRNHVRQVRLRQRAESRLLVLGLFFLAAFGTVAVKMGGLAMTGPQDPGARQTVSAISSARAPIVDRNGAVLATNLLTSSLYAHPHEMIEPVKAAEGLARIFPTLDRDKLIADFTGTRKFIWVRKTVSPEERQAVHELGEPGLLFGTRDLRLYPNGALAAHILGGAKFGEESVHAAEILGVAGVEQRFNARLNDPDTLDTPLELSIDLTVQAAMEQVLGTGMRLMQARGAASILMDAHTGEIIAMASLPDFDPNQRPAAINLADPSESPLFNRAAQGVYELGSTFKIFAAANTLELGQGTPETMIDTRGPLKYGQFTIKDFKDYGPKLSVHDVMVHSSNIGTARMALATGAGAQQELLKKLGFFEPVPVELAEASLTQPLLPPRWSDISTMTVSYGHGIAATPLHLATAYASVTNGGFLVTPTLLKQTETTPGASVLRPETSAQLRAMLRAVVTDGTASFGEVRGYEVGGKTGSADKPNPDGGYFEDKVIATFASVFPSSDPKYVMVVTLDEPSIEILGETRRTAGWTAVPVSAELVARLMPLLGERPNIASAGNVQYTGAKPQQ